MDKRMFKKTPEELQMYMHFKKRHGVSKIKKGKGSYTRKQKHREKFDFSACAQYNRNIRNKCPLNSAGQSANLTSSKSAVRVCQWVPKDWFDSSSIAEGLERRELSSILSEM